MIVRILVVEDVAFWRERLVDVLRAEGYEVHSATSLEETRQLLYQVKPDVLVLDMRLRAHGYQGWTILDELDVMPNSPKVIVCTGEIDDPRQLREMRHGFGVFDIIQKERYQKDHFIQTVRDAVEAKCRADAEEDEEEDENETSIELLTASNTDEPCPLTESEKKVLREVARGKSNEEIAMNLGKSVDTVKKQLSTAYKKLKITGRINAVNKARELSCIPREG